MIYLCKLSEILVSIYLKLGNLTLLPLNKNSFKNKRKNIVKFTIIYFKRLYNLLLISGLPHTQAT